MPAPVYTPMPNTSAILAAQSAALAANNAARLNSSLALPNMKRSGGTTTPETQVPREVATASKSTAAEGFGVLFSASLVIVMLGAWIGPAVVWCFEDKPYRALGWFLAWVGLFYVLSKVL